MLRSSFPVKQASIQPRVTSTLSCHTGSSAQTILPLPLDDRLPLRGNGSRLLLDARFPLGDVLSLHSIPRALEATSLCRGAGKEPHVHVVVLHQLLQWRQHLVPYQLLATLGSLRGRGRAGVLERDEGRCVVVGHTAEDIDEDRIGLGDVEPDVGNWVADELGEDGEDGAREYG